MNTFGNRLRILRLEQKLKGEELGKIFNFSKSTISSWENETREPPQKILRDLAKFFDVSLDYLLGTSDLRRKVMVNDKVKKEIEGFTVKLIKQLIESDVIKTVDDIDENMVQLIKSSLYMDIANKKKDWANMPGPSFCPLYALLTLLDLFHYN